MTQWVYIYGFFGVMVLVQCITMIAYWRVKQRQQRYEEQLINLLHEQKAITSGAMGLGRRLSQFNNHLKYLEKSHEDIKQRDISDKSFEQASKLLKMGASIEDIVESCHLSRGEAELINDMLGLAALH